MGLCARLLSSLLSVLLLVSAVPASAEVETTTEDGTSTDASVEGSTDTTSSETTTTDTTSSETTTDTTTSDTSEPTTSDTGTSDTSETTTTDSSTSETASEPVSPGHGVVLPPGHTDGVPRHGRSEARAWGHESSTTVTVDHIRHTIGANGTYARGLTGAGIGVALIDTGVVPVAGLTDVVHGPDLSLDAHWANLRHLDAYGHGTHLAGLITSDRTDARGIAPNARLISVKAGSARGAVDVSQLIAAIDWVVQHRQHHNIRVLVLPFGTDSTQDPAIDPLMHAAEVAWRAGIVVVASAGNHAAERAAVSSPGRTGSIITVAAADTLGTTSVSDDTVAAFSAPGTTARRPDVTAPGVGVLSTAATGSYLAQRYPDAVKPGALMRGHGTSQAAAVVGAAVALLLESRPSLTPDQVKGLLHATGRPLAGLVNPAAGAGMISVDPAVGMAKSQTLAGFPQAVAPSAGTGTLQGARGTHHILSADRQRILTGEVDIHGQPFHAPSWALAASEHASWSGGAWNGTVWTGTGWTTSTFGSVTGAVTWVGHSWDGHSWDGHTWSGHSWDGHSWDGHSWDGHSWDGHSWDGHSWDGHSWDAVRWDGHSWDGHSWDGHSWDGHSWDGHTWSSVRWD